MLTEKEIKKIAREYVGDNRIVLTDNIPNRDRTKTRKRPAEDSDAKLLVKRFEEEAKKPGPSDVEKVESWVDDDSILPFGLIDECETCGVLDYPDVGFEKDGVVYCQECIEKLCK